MKGSIRQRSKGSWQLRYEGPPDINGKRRYLSETVRGNKKGAEMVLRERMAAMENGGYVAKHKETVAEFMQRWMDTYVATNTTARTREGYQGNISRYIVPSVGFAQVQNLTARQIQGMYADMLERGLSARTVVHPHRVSKEALGHAVKGECCLGI